MERGKEPKRTWLTPTRATGLVLGFLLAAPGAFAAMSLDLTPPADPLDPETGLELLAWTATIDCSDLVGATGVPGVAEAYVLQLQVDEAPNYVSLGGEYTHAVDTETCTTDPVGTATVTGAFDLALGRDAPALTDVPVHMSAVLDRPEPFSQALPHLNASAQTAVQAAPFFLMQAKVAQKVVQTSGGEVVFDVEVTNFGNSPILVTPSLTDATEGASAWFQGADPVHLAWNGADDGAGAQEILQVRFDIPNSGLWSNSQGLFTFDLTASHEGHEGDPASINLLIRHRGSAASEASPAWGLLLAVPALVAVAVVLRRRS